MRRRDKLRAQLEALETDLQSALARELRKIINGTSSRYLFRKTWLPGEGRYWRRPEVGRLERLEKDILHVRSALREELPGPLLSLLEEFVTESRAAKDAFAGGSAHIAKKCLRRVQNAV